MPLESFFTPPQLAARYGVKPATVLGWIRSGELVGINVGRRGATRPRFRVSASAVQAFEAARSATVTTPAPPARRRRTTGSVIQFY